jgi:hypothetical protein
MQALLKNGTILQYGFLPGNLYYDDPNQFGACISCYLEQDAHTLTNDGNNLVIGGFAALNGKNGSMTSHGHAITMYDASFENANTNNSPKQTAFKILSNSSLALIYGGVNVTDGTALGWFNQLDGSYTLWNRHKRRR